MTDNNDVRTPPPGEPKVEVRENLAPPISGRNGSRAGLVAGGVIALLLLAGTVYYFTGDRADPQVATEPDVKQSDSAPPAAESRPADSANQQAAAPQPSAPSATAEPQTPPPAMTQTTPSDAQAAPTPAPSAVTPPVAPATPPQTATNDVPPAAPPAAEPQPTMRDQAAALPDQKAIMLVVKRGPANIRATPGGRVIGTAAVNEQVKQITHAGGWIEVEAGSVRGWIASTLLGPSEP